MHIHCFDEKWSTEIMQRFVKNVPFGINIGKLCMAVISLNMQTIQIGQAVQFNSGVRSPRGSQIWTSNHLEKKSNVIFAALIRNSTIRLAA